MNEVSISSCRFPFNYNNHASTISISYAAPRPTKTATWNSIGYGDTEPDKAPQSAKKPAGFEGD
jgi:hypothetical protein